jgi:hypothetical protein
VGLDDLFDFDPCKSEYGGTGALCALPEGAPFDSSFVNCAIFSDNNYPSVIPGGSKATNTYITPSQSPGIHWASARVGGRTHAAVAESCVRVRVCTPLSDAPCFPAVPLPRSTTTTSTAPSPT